MSCSEPCDYAKEEGNDEEEADKDYTPPNNESSTKDDKNVRAFFLAHRDGEQNHQRLSDIMVKDTKDCASLDMVINVTEHESNLDSLCLDLKESSNSGTSHYRGTLGPFTREDNGERMYRDDMVPLSSRGGDNTVLGVLPVPFSTAVVTNKPMNDLAIEKEHTSSLADMGAQSTPQLELERKASLMASDLENICRDNNSLLTLPNQWSSTIMSSLKTSKDSTCSRKCHTWAIICSRMKRSN